MFKVLISSDEMKQCSRNKSVAELPLHIFEDLNADAC